VQLCRPPVYVGSDVLAEPRFDRLQNWLQVGGVPLDVQATQALDRLLPQPSTGAPEPQDDIEQRAALQTEGARAGPNCAEVEEAEQALDFLANFDPVRRARRSGYG
jgi:hypothetical protein